MTLRSLHPGISSLLLAWGLAACGGLPQGQKNNKGIDGLLARVERRDVVLTIDAPGEIKPVNQVEVKPEVSAKVKKIFVKDGQEVEEGMELVQLDDTEILASRSTVESDIEGARFSKEQAERDFARSKQLYAKKLISKEIFESDRTNFEVASNSFEKSQRQLKLSDDRLAKTRIRSPMKGRVLQLTAQEGQVAIAAASVNSGTTLMQVADLTKLMVVTHVNQVEIAKLSPNRPVEISLDSIPSSKMTGRVELVASVATIKSSVKGFEVRVLIENPDARIRPGMTADTKFWVAEAKNALVVPISAVFEDRDGKNVVYVQTEKAAVKSEVETGIVNFEWAEILSGVKEGDSVWLVRPEGEEKKSRGTD